MWGTVDLIIREERVKIKDLCKLGKRRMWSPKGGTGFSAELKRRMWKKKRVDV